MANNTAAPSSRTRIRRLSELADYTQQTLFDIIDEAYVCHIAFNDGDNTHCIPTACWRIDDFLYIHGSNGGRLTKALLSGNQASVSITHVDGLVLAKSAFSHTMHYRSAVIYGAFEQVRGSSHKMNAMNAFMEKIAQGRQHEARPGNEKELAATSVLRISLHEAVAKVSKNGPIDKPEDVDLPVWAGVLPLRVAKDAPIPLENQKVATPDYVLNWSKLS
jgi:nitroimidazol reductase NimA-like FMN-containing flavoprotein (pyridoxamine 5'-phosphate oxidase superfamily)